MNKILVLFFFCFLYGSYAQNEKQLMTVKEYIDTYKDIAVQNMKNFRIPASITLAQGILESSNGNSDLAIKANNHFGIKCTSDWQGRTFLKDDDKKDDCFRVYDAALESYKDHSSFLTKRQRYAALFTLAKTDYKAWAQGLKDAGYATNPLYPQLLIKIIEDNRLFELDTCYPPSTNVQLTVETKKINEETEDFEVITIGQNNRKVFLNNNIKFVLVKKGDTFYKIAVDFEMKPGELYRYNDFSTDYILKEGEKVYLQPKRRKADVEFHVVKSGETMLSISQLYGIKLKLLYRKNRMEENAPAPVGEKLWLRKKKK